MSVKCRSDEAKREKQCSMRKDNNNNWPWTLVLTLSWRSSCLVGTQHSIDSDTCSSSLGKDWRKRCSFSFSFSLCCCRCYCFKLELRTIKEWRINLLHKSVRSLTYPGYWRKADGCECKVPQVVPKLDTCKPQHNELCRFALIVTQARSSLWATYRLLLLSMARTSLFECRSVNNRCQIGSFMMCVHIYIFEDLLLLTRLSNFLVSSIVCPSWGSKLCEHFQL